MKNILVLAGAVLVSAVLFALPYTVVTHPAYPSPPFLENMPGEEKTVSIELGDFESVDGRAKLLDPRAKVVLVAPGAELVHEGLDIVQVLDSTWEESIYGVPSERVHPVSMRVRLPSDPALYGVDATLVVATRFRYPAVTNMDRFRSSGEFEEKEGQVTREFPFRFGREVDRRDVSEPRHRSQVDDHERELSSWKTVQSGTALAGALVLVGAAAALARGVWKRRRTARPA